ncbi:hypothetical protein [Chlamydia vaughanii]|uniref:hypothetical protein n=1 Tax=Chlamydia vaughanii TaxID=3112552 RepID=UPI0032B12649
MGINSCVSRDKLLPISPLSPGKIFSKALKITGTIATAVFLILTVVGAQGFAQGSCLGLLISGITGLGLLFLVFVFVVSKEILRKKAHKERLEENPAFHLKNHKNSTNLLENTTDCPVSVSQIDMEPLGQKESTVPVAEGPHPPLSSPAQQALQFAEAYLRTHSGSVSHYAWEKGFLSPPINEKLSMLYDLTLAKNRELRVAIGTAPRDKVRYPRRGSWKQVNRLAKEHMQLAFATSYFTLQELQGYRERFPNVRSDLEVISASMACYRNTYYLMPFSYYLMRFLHINCVNPPDERAQSAREALFYTPETRECHFRILYNSFCELARWHLGDPNQIKNPSEEYAFLCSNQDLNPGFQEPC